MNGTQPGPCHDAGIMIGKFQMVTLGHLAGAAAMAEGCGLAVLACGSANQSRDTRNPWTADERREMWLAALPASLHARFRFVFQEDLGNPLRWASAIEHRMARTLRDEGIDPDDASIGLYGHRKDATSFYLDDFPAWILEQLPNVDGINASDLRAGYFRTSRFDAWAAEARSKVPAGVVEWLRVFRGRDAYARLSEEASRADATAAAHPDAGVLVDATAVVVQGNRVLMRRRQSFPGKGYWSLPEGAVHLREEPLEAAMRIAIERTSLDVSRTVLRKALRDTWTRTDPFRTTKSRTITFPSVFQLTPTPSGRTAEERRRSMALPRIRASDDTAFLTFDEVRSRRSEIFADHAIIVDQALERLGMLPGA
jgi:bifunctional NMN adenylyltransferase/nudix hydrolase